jgi:hypothetical protein
VSLGSIIEIFVVGICGVSKKKTNPFYRVGRVKGKKTELAFITIK